MPFWETLLETKSFDYKAGERNLGAITLVLDLTKAFERFSIPAVWTWTTHSNLLRNILRVLGGHFEHQQSVQFEGCVAEPLQAITAISLDRNEPVCSIALCPKMLWVK